MAVSKRLQAMLNFVGQANVLADIGTDHAYLPIEACLADICHRAIACDLNKGPLETADANINAAGLTHRIETRLGNGLAPLNINEADVITISGMGSHVMWNILQTHPEIAKSTKYLILQPQHDYLENFRKNLHATGYEIFNEALVYEDSRFYVIMQVSHTGRIFAWTPHEYFLGKFLTNSPFFPKYVEYHRNKIARFISNCDTATRETAETRLKMLL